MAVFIVITHIISSIIHSSHEGGFNCEHISNYEGSETQHSIPGHIQQTIAYLGYDEPWIMLTWGCRK